MMCIGPHLAPTKLESQAAQLWVKQCFSVDFLRRYKTGIVISEYEYMGRTTFAHPSGPILTPNPLVNKVLDGLASNFRNWNKPYDYRKSDIMGISGDGRYGETIEVTTENNAQSAITQSVEKLTILLTTVNKLLNAPVDWKPSRWRPSGAELFMALPSPAGGVRWVCYAPTIRKPAPEGVVLYEIHALELQKAPARIAVPKELSDKIKDQRRSIPIRRGAEEQWAREFLAKYPGLKTVLRGLLLLGSIALIIIALVALFDPVPGDEAAAFIAAMALMRQATS